MDLMRCASGEGRCGAGPPCEVLVLIATRRRRTGCFEAKKPRPGRRWPQNKYAAGGIHHHRRAATVEQQLGLYDLFEPKTHGRDDVRQCPACKWIHATI